jgi:Domain of unknown function (DUF4388)
MSHYSIVILDTDESRTDYFEGMFKKDEHAVSVHSTIGSTIQHTEKSDKIAFLVDYSTLTAEERPDVIRFFKEFARQNIFLFNVPDNANKRLAFYELGAKRVFDTSHPLDEIYYALVWPIKNIAAKVSKNLMISSGALEDVSLKNLINNLSREDRTGILKIITENNSGKIYFKDGIITHAQVGLHTGEDALLHMLFWHEGNFKFNATTALNESISVHLSVVSLFIIAERLRKVYLKNLQDIGSPKAVVQIIYAGDLKNSSIDIKDGFTELILRPVQLKALLENPFYTCCETAQKLAELKSNGYLLVTDGQKVKKEKKAESAAGEIPLGAFTLLNKEEAQELCHQISLDKLQSGKILVISTHGKSGYHLLQAVVEKGSDILQSKNMHQCKVEVLTQTHLSFISFAMDETVLDTVIKTADTFSAIIFLIDVQQADKFEYTSYVMRELVKNEDICWLPCGINMMDSIDLGHIKLKLGIPGHVPFDIYDTTDQDDVKNILLRLKKYKQPEPQKEDDEEEIGQIEEGDV